MSGADDHGPQAFFAAMTQAFDGTIRARRGRHDFVGALCLQAFDSFDGNVAIQAEGAPALACKGDCPACCVIRVVATAPEVFLVSRFVAANAAFLTQHGVDLVGRIRGAAAASGLGERERMALQRICPFIEDGLCLAYRVRPLACRGHASYDEAACRAATAGAADVEAAISTPHLVVRSLVQNAMMASLRGAGLAFGLYELNGAVTLALSTPEAELRWTEGEDPLSSAAVADFDAKEAAAAFDALRGAS